MSRVVLVVAAHADDEVLGCGGSIARHVALGDIVHVVFMADGVSSRSQSTEKQLALRNEGAEKASGLLGVTTTTYLALPDNRMDSLPLIDIVQSLEKIIAKIQPEVVYTHHYGDLNVDHRLTHQAVMTSCRPQPGSCIREILAFEVLSSTEWQSPGLTPFVPNVFIDVSDYLDKKMEALTAYDLEMKKAPHSRSRDNVVHLARYRGHSVGLFAAEAYMQIRRIEFEKKE